ncbi:unnamed protein product [Diplocarpon coronariae]
MSDPLASTTGASCDSMVSASSSPPDPVTNTTPGQPNGFKSRYENGLERTRQGMLKGFRDVASTKDSRISELQGTNDTLLDQLRDAKSTERDHEDEIEIMRQSIEDLENENGALRSELKKTKEDYESQMNDWTTDMKVRLDAADSKILKDQATAKAEMKTTSENYGRDLKALEERIAELKSRVMDEKRAKDSALLELTATKETHKLELNFINMDLNTTRSAKQQLLDQINAAIVATAYQGNGSEFLASLVSVFVDVRDRIQGLTNQFHASAEAVEYTGSMEDFQPWIIDRLKDLDGALKMACSRPVEAAEKVPRQYDVISGLKEEIKKKNANLAELEADINTLRSRMSVAGTKIADQTKTVTDLESGVWAEKIKIQKVLTACKCHTSEITSLKEKVRSLQAVIEEKKTIITQHREEILTKTITWKDEASRLETTIKKLAAEIEEKFLTIKKQQEELLKWRPQGHRAKHNRKREESEKSGENLFGTLHKNIEKDKEKTECPLDVLNRLKAMREEVLKDHMIPPTLAQFRQMNRINAERKLAENSVMEQIRTSVQDAAAPLPTVVDTAVQPSSPDSPVISTKPKNNVVILAISSTPDSRGTGSDTEKTLVDMATGS